jgi:protein SCO1
VKRLAHRLFLIALLSLALSACHHPTPAAKHYPFTGRIVTIDAQNQSALIDGDDIPGFMDAMTMSYKIKPPSVLSQLARGDTISAEVVVIGSESNADSATEYWLENVKVTARGKAPPLSQRIPAPGDQVPDFAFINQDGRRVSIDQFRGKTLLVTFIYTRCPFPDFCPRVTSNFAEIQKQLISDPHLADIRLLSLSFDPEHDTPTVLRGYGYTAAHTRDRSLFQRWQFAVPSAADLPRVADFFGLVYKPENALITHNLSTAVIGPDGKIVAWYHGSDWQVSDLIRDASSATATTASNH